MPRPRFRSLACLAVALAAATPCASAQQGEDPPAYDVADGLTVTPATTPGLVKHPVMATLDDRGRLFVAENAGVNLDKEQLLEQRPNSIRLLEDTDGDGVFDQGAVFAENLTFPQGALWIHGSLYVMSPPSLWRFEDEDGDGRAEVREELVTGLDFTGNAASVHGPFLHPNGRLHWCHGRKGFAVPDPDTGEILHEGKGARIWSCQLGGGDVQPFAGGGMDNPVEIDFTDRGEIIGTVNLFYGRPRGDTLTHWVHGGAYPRHDMPEVLEEFRRTGDLLPPVHNFGHVAVSGMCRYRSGHLDPAWRDQWLVTHFNTGRLTRTKLARDGAGFAAGETETIFHLTEPDAHLTDVLEDRNGDLLAIDTGGWFRNGCPTSHIAKPDVAGGIYRIARADESYTAPSYPDWSERTAGETAEFLAAEEDWLRERAVTELAVRGDPALPELRRIIRSTEEPARAEPARARRHAVWTLARMEFSESADLIYLALTDPDASVRQAACNAVGVTRTWRSVAANQPAERRIELARNQTISGALAGMVRGDDPPIARAAATALGRMAEDRAIGALLGRLGRAGDDRFLRHALIYALIEIDDYDATHPALESRNADLLSGALWALDQMPSSRLEVLDVLPFLEAEHDGLHEAAVSIAARHPEWDAALANRFFDWDGEFDPRRLAVLDRLVPAFAGSPPMTHFLTSLVTSDDPDTVDHALAFLEDSPSLEFQPEWESAFRPLLQPDADPDRREAALDVLALASDHPFEDALQELSADAELPRLVRVKAARALADRRSVLPGQAFELVLEILRDSSDYETRSRALALLGETRLSQDRRTELAAVAKHFTPVEMNGLFQHFRRIHNEEQARHLADAIVDSPAFPSFDPDRLRQLFRPFDASIKQKIEKRLAEAEKEKAARSERIDALLEDMENADPAAGKEVFLAGKGACLVCHRIGEQGGKVGPDLGAIGRIRSARDLFESILFPSESIARDFETHEVKLSEPEGATRLGLVEKRGPAAIELIDPAGHRHRIPRDDIESIVPVRTSLMPMGLDQTMTKEEFRDLVAFLLSRE